MTACICRPGDPEGWYREDCRVHGREAQEERAESDDPRVPHVENEKSPSPGGLGL